MRSASRSEDLTRKAAIREVALDLFAEHGHRSVTVRQIAAAAGVSPALLNHHFGSKDGLVDAVNEFVAATFDQMLTDASVRKVDPLSSTSEAGSIAELFATVLRPDSPVPAYLRRLLAEQDPAAGALVASLFATTSDVIAGMVTDGRARPSADPSVRAAFLVINDLAMIMLRDVVADLIDDDPLSAEGIRRWLHEALDIYSNGIFIPPPQDTT
jgi:AcrR family transcriptional regulator